MKYHDLKAVPNKAKKRVGRGIGSGHGKTAGRGTKGQNARTGGGVRPGFEGGQNPLMKRLPKARGVRSHRKPAEIVQTQQLNSFRAKSTVTKESLAEAGLISSPKARVKLLLKGDVEKELTVELDSASKSATQALEAAGGKFKGIS